MAACGCGFELHRWFRADALGRRRSDFLVRGDWDLLLMSSHTSLRYAPCIIFCAFVLQVLYQEVKRGS